MCLRAHERMLEEEEERNRRYGLEHDPDDEFADELELADRIGEQASLPAGHPQAHAAARYLLGRGPCPYEQPHEPEPQRCSSEASLQNARAQVEYPLVAVELAAVDVERLVLDEEPDELAVGHVDDRLAVLGEAEAALSVADRMG